VSTDSVFIPAEFPQLQSKVAEDTFELRNLPIKSHITVKPIFFCCGEDLEENKYTLED
jgi:hypothetical protein